MMQHKELLLDSICRLLNVLRSDITEVIGSLKSGGGGRGGVEEREGRRGKRRGWGSGDGGRRKEGRRKEGRRRGGEEVVGGMREGRRQEGVISDRKERQQPHHKTSGAA